MFPLTATPWNLTRSLPVTSSSFCLSRPAAVVSIRPVDRSGHETIRAVSAVSLNSPATRRYGAPLAMDTNEKSSVHGRTDPVTTSEHWVAEVGWLYCITCGST